MDKYIQWIFVVVVFIAAQLFIISMKMPDNELLALYKENLVLEIELKKLSKQ